MIFLEKIGFRSAVSVMMLMLMFNYSCSSEQKNKSAELDKNTKSIVNENPKDLKMRENLEGVWYSNREPSAMQFFGDGTYRCFLPEGHTEPDSPEEEFENGNWIIKGGVLSLESAKGKTQTMPIIWVKDSLIYLGDLAAEYDPNYGTQEEFAAEMGFSKK